ncbi:MAG: DUF58 domain-containing protein [Proteobacteria bacterium]|nr:DUF58 domain-containing protein [Pseudomonadota bacterium]
MNKAENISNHLDQRVVVLAKTMVEQRLYAGQFTLASLKKATSAISGMHDSRFRGRGMDYLESRVYQAGDDIRNMDWRVTARTGVAHTKLFQEERERPTHIVVDCNSSMFFGTKTQFKSVLAAKVAALLGWSSVKQGDRVGILSYGINGIHLTKPTSGKRGMMGLISHLVNANAATNTRQSHNLDQALQQLRTVNRPGSMIIIISDFYNLGESAKRHLIQLRKHNNVLAILTSDPFELHSPIPALYGIQNQAKSMVLDIRQNKIKQKFDHYKSLHSDQIVQNILKAGVRVLPIQTNDPVVNTLKSSLKNPAIAFNNWLDKVSQ